MSELIKMSDVFGDGFNLCNESCFINDGESDLGSLSCNSFTDAAVIAINSYDANQALITKQAEQIKMLRDALEMFRPEIYYNQNGEEVDVGGNFTIYSDGEADNEAMRKVHDALEATKPVEE